MEGFFVFVFNISAVDNGGTIVKWFSLLVFEELLLN
jgi:hypothetical protein